MSSCHQEQVTCPKCGQISEAKIWDSINVQIDPAMKEQVETLEAFSFTCPHCGNEALMKYNFLYHDMDEAVMIYVVVNEEGRRMAEDTFTERSIAVMKEKAAYRFRIVSSFEGLLEKILLADAGLDDRVVELLKIIAENQVQAQFPDFHATESRFIETAEGEQVIHLQDEQGQALDVDYAASFSELYEKLKDEFAEELEELSKDSLVIDKSWAEQFLDKVMP